MDWGSILIVITPMTKEKTNNYSINLNVNGIAFKVHGFRALYPFIDEIEIPLILLWPCNVTLCNEDSFSYNHNSLKLEYIK